MKTRVIFDGTVYPDKSNQSETFKNGLFLAFDFPSEPPENNNLIGFNLVVRTPAIGFNSLDRNVPVTVDESEVQGILKQTDVITIPEAIRKSGLECFCQFGSFEEMNLRVYLFYLDDSECDVCAKLNDIIFNQTVAQIADTIRYELLAANQVAQNTALVGIGTLAGITAAPLTGGSTLAAGAAFAALLTPTTSALGGSLIGNLLPLLPGV